MSLDLYLTVEYNYYVLRCINISSIVQLAQYKMIDCTILMTDMANDPFVNNEVDPIENQLKTLLLNHVFTRNLFYNAIVFIYATF